ncbi:MAG: hypothetical protein BMS9Abin31_0668 [Gammaproteobacteria bacterium]|nr:MAG: hypothetical protein BMS9Abin31_0668 [Gammaproteobacteria bacterium]
MSETNNISAELSGEARQELADKLNTYQDKLKALPADSTDLERALLQLDISELLLALDQKEHAWNEARSTFDIFIKNEEWQHAVEACNVMYQTEQPASIVALGHAVWLAVTYPIEADTSVAVLNHIVDETPATSDGAAVAAMTGYYIADIRSTDENHDSMTFLAKTILGNVAKRHSNVQTQKEMDAWLFKLELNDPEVFIPRLSLVVNSIVEENWWFDRDDLRSCLPVN